jgi:hypothetical protein
MINKDIRLASELELIRNKEIVKKLVSRIKAKDNKYFKLLVKKGIVDEN